MNKYIATIDEAGEHVIYAENIAKAAAKFVAAWGDEAVLEIHRADPEEARP